MSKTSGANHHEPRIVPACELKCYDKFYQKPLNSQCTKSSRKSCILLKSIIKIARWTVTLLRWIIILLGKEKINLKIGKEIWPRNRGVLHITTKKINLCS